MNNYKVQRYQTQITIPLNNDTEDAPIVDQLNGILRGITINAPALTGSSYVITVLGQRGETIFTKSGVVENVLTYLDTKTVGAVTYPLDAPLSLKGVSPVRIKSTGTPDAVATITFSNLGAILDDETVTIGDQVYRFKDTLAAANDVLIEPDVKAQGLIDCGATGPIATNTLTVGDTEYTIVAALSSGPTIPNEILLEIDVDDTLANIKVAINGGAGIGVKYSTGTVANTSAEATTLNDTNHTLLIQALVAGTDGNDIDFIDGMGDTTFDGSGKLGGTQAGAWSGDATLANLADAINLEDAGGESGVKYHEDTPANEYVTAGAVISHAVIVTAVDGVDDPTDVATLEDSSVLSWGADTLVGGGEAAPRAFDIDLLIDRG